MRPTGGVRSASERMRPSRVRPVIIVRYLYSRNGRWFSTERVCTNRIGRPGPISTISELTASSGSAAKSRNEEKRHEASQGLGRYLRHSARGPPGEDKSRG